MTNTSFSFAEATGKSPPVAILEYREIGNNSANSALADETDLTRADKGSSGRISLRDDELALRLEHAAAEGARAAEERLRRELEQRLDTERRRVTEMIGAFQQERAEYYGQVEPELVHLILAVASKILHREAQVDPMLIAALAKIAVENLQQRTHVVLRVNPELCRDWRDFFAAHLPGTKVEVLEDSQMEPGGCVLETELGAAEIGIEAQLKEIERGFFDLLAKRPEP